MVKLLLWFWEVPYFRVVVGELEALVNFFIYANNRATSSFSSSSSKDRFHTKMKEPKFGGLSTWSKILDKTGTPFTWACCLLCRAGRHNTRMSPLIQLV